MDVATETFEQEVLARSHELPVVVDFWAAWCGPCLMLGPVLEREAEARTGELALVKVDVDQNQELALEYGIRGIPAVKAFRNGEVVSEFVGALPPAAVAQFLDELTGPSAAETLVAELRAAGELPEVVAAPAPERHARVSAALACGVERWTVKTLQDRPKLLPVRPTIIAHLVSLPRPSSLPATRLPFERHVFSLIATVTLVRLEDAGDLHLVLRQGVKHMIAESPSPACTTRATAYRRRQMRSARNAVRLCSRARVVGVAFFDFKHGQTGLAPNAIELHPILGFACLSD